MGTKEAIIYSYDVATMPSVLPAFASRKDLIVMDEACAWPQRSGAQLSRAKGAPPSCAPHLQQLSWRTCVWAPVCGAE